MKKDTQKRGISPGLWAFVRSCRVQLAFLAAGAAVLGVFRCTRSNRTWMDWFVQHVSAPWKRILSGALDAIPFSAGELVCAGLVIALTFGVLFTLRRRMEGERVILRRLLGLGAAMLWAYVGMCAFWGVHYYGTGFQEKAGLETRPVSVMELWNTADWFAQQVNAVADRVPRDEEGLFCVRDEVIFSQFPDVYNNIEKEYPCLAVGPQRRPKQAVFSRLMSIAGFTGYLFPFTGEATLNMDAPAVFLPVTLAHEASHQRGVAPEQEANFVGIAASISSGLPVYEYSGYLFAWMHLTNALYGTAPRLYNAQWNNLSPAAQKDLMANARYWQGLQGPARQAVEKTYTGFLHSYGQVLGMQSYGACVDLLVARYGSENSRDLKESGFPMPELPF